MKEYKMNFATKTLTVTKAFAEEALNPDSEASTIIANCRAVCSTCGLHIARTSPPRRAILQRA